MIVGRSEPIMLCGSAAYLVSVRPNHLIKDYKKYNDHSVDEIIYTS
jgi:hypothetical protein